MTSKTVSEIVRLGPVIPVLAFDTVEHALTAANIERLYGTPVRLVKLDARRYACVPGA